MTQPDAVTRVAQDLSAIETMVAALPGQAVRRAADPDMPGGDATVALGPVALPSEWAEGIAWHELHHLSTCPRPTHRDCRYAEHAADARDDDDPLGILLFWTEQMREQRGYPLAGRRPTWATEASFLRHSLTWARETEPHFADLARDVATVRARLESLLHDGIRSVHGVRCFTCGAGLVRKVKPRTEPDHCPGHDGVCAWPHDRCPHDRGGLADEWTCEECGRRYSDADYRRAVAHAHWAWAEWLPLADAAERTGLTPGAIKMRASRGDVARKREDGRTVYRMADLEDARASVAS